MFKTLARQSIRTPWRSAVRFNSNNFKLNTDSHVYKYLGQTPKFVKFTADHEWVAVHADKSAFIGITDYASSQLGDATFVELPEIGATYQEGESIGSVESVKSASEIYSPVTGEVVGINDVLESKPQLINEDAMGAGWIAHIKFSEEVEEIEKKAELMDEAKYTAYLEEQ